MTRKLHDCGACSLRAMTMPDCAECKGVGQYWADEHDRYGFRPRDSGGGIAARPIRPADRAQILRLEAQGWRTGEIASALRLPIKAVGEAKVRAPIARLSDEVFMAVWAEFQAGAESVALAAKHGLSKGYFRSKLTRRRARALGAE